MYVLYVEDQTSLLERSWLFEQYMEPLLKSLEAFYQTNSTSATLPEIQQYLQVCRWPFRRLEYSFALEALLNHLQPGCRYLDAGCGVTPLAYVFARLGVYADACDNDSRLIDQLRQLNPDRLYGAPVAYAVQDLTATSYPDAAFDAISCISVLEHIPAPDDQKAIYELLRILKPGGILVLTVDFTPISTAKPLGRLQYYLRRVIALTLNGNISEVKRGIVRKLRARQVVRQGAARKPRSANQCFEIEHLEQDILPLLNARGQEINSYLNFSTDLRSVTPAHARRFWEIEAGLYNNQGRRAVLPVGYILRKSGANSVSE
jgi:SAM-dependent methyltransferase